MITEFVENLSQHYPEVKFGKNVSVGVGVQIGAFSCVASGVCIYPGTVIGKNVQILENSVLGRPTIIPSTNRVVKRTEVDHGPLVIGDNTVIGANVVLYENSVVGRDCIICDLTSIRENCEIGQSVLLGRSVMIQVSTKIGSRTKIMDSCHLPGDMEVGSDVFMSTHVCGASENSTGRSDAKGQWSGPRIMDRVYIGLNATLLPGITLHQDCVVGAGSVVTKDVPALSLVMGVPAKVVRQVTPLPT